MLSYLPTWLHGHRGDLLHYERMAQRYYRLELQQYEPVLRERGELCVGPGSEGVCDTGMQGPCMLL